MHLGIVMPTPNYSRSSSRICGRHRYPWREAGNAICDAAPGLWRRRRLCRASLE